MTGTEVVIMLCIVILLFVFSHLVTDKDFNKNVKSIAIIVLVLIAIVFLIFGVFI